MRKLQLLLIAVAVVVAGALVGASEVSAQNTGDCVQSCKEECAVLSKDERKSCKFSCMGGRCGISGVIVAAQATSEPGVDCSEDGECNAFCEAEPDPDCCAPSTTPLRAIQVPFGSVSVATQPPPYSGFEINVSGLGPQVGGYPWCSLGSFYVWDAGTSYAPNQVPSRTCVTAEQVRLQPSVDEGNPVTAAGDYLTLDYKLDVGGLSSSAIVFLPELTGDLTSVMLYPAVDGSTYFDEELTQLAANACDYTVACPCWVDQTIEEFFAGYTENLLCACWGAECGIGAAVYSARSAEAQTEGQYRVASCVYRDGAGNYVSLRPITAAEGQACVSEVKEFIAAHIGTPVAANTDDPPGVCGEL